MADKAVSTSIAQPVRSRSGYPQPGLSSTVLLSTVLLPTIQVQSVQPSTVELSTVYQVKRRASSEAAGVTAQQAAAELHRRIDAMNETAWSITRANPQQALEQCTAALDLARQVGYAFGIATALLRLGTANWQLANYDSALAASREALVRFRALADASGEQSALNSLGALYSLLGDYPQALTFLQQGLRASEASDDLNAQSVFVNNIAGVYDLMNDFDQALAAFQHSLSLKKTLGNERGAATSQGNAGQVYISLGKPKQALTMLKKSLRGHRSVGNKIGEASVLGSLGQAHEALGDLAQAALFYHDSLRLREQLGEKDGETFSHISLGKLSVKRRAFADARLHLDAALQLATETKSLDNLSQAHEALSDFFSAAGEAAKALEHYRLFHKAHLDLFNEKSIRQTKHLRIAFEVERLEKEKEIYRLQAWEWELHASHKTKELTTLAMTLVEKREFFESVFETVSEAVRATPKKSKALLRTLLSRTGSARRGLEWGAFEAQFKGVYPDFLHALLKKAPKLTPTELKVASLVKMNLPNKDIARLLSVSVRNVETHRYALRKKLRLRNADNLSTFFTSL